LATISLFEDYAVYKPTEQLPKLYILL